MRQWSPAATSCTIFVVLAWVQFLKTYTAVTSSWSLLAAACCHCHGDGRADALFVARQSIYFLKASYNCCHVSQVLLLFLPFLAILLFKVPHSTSTAFNLVQGFMNNLIKNFSCWITFVITFLKTITASLISAAHLHSHCLSFWQQSQKV